MKSTALNLDLFSSKYDYLGVILNSLVLGYGLWRICLEVFSLPVFLPFNRL